jgi:HlyD family secretion protein
MTAAEARVREAQASAEIARSDVAVAEAQLLNVAAGVASHEAAVRDAELQVTEMTIRAPMDGVVLDHSVLVGQSVGVAPLFTVASDLHRLVLHANVDEADIGRIQAGQSAAFSVDTYPDQKFAAVVTLVKHSPQVSQNIVTYDVELAVDDPDGRLLPGMTATASIVTGRDAGALRVPTSALRFKPPGMAGGGPSAVWTTGRDGEPVRHTVQPGRSDEVYTSVAAGDLSAGDAVIVGTVSRPEARSRDKSIFGL